MDTVANFNSRFLALCTRSCLDLPLSSDFAAKMAARVIEIKYFKTELSLFRHHRETYRVLATLFPKYTCQVDQNDILVRYNGTDVRQMSEEDFAKVVATAPIGKVNVVQFLKKESDLRYLYPNVEV